MDTDLRNSDRSSIAAEAWRHARYLRSLRQDPSLAPEERRTLEELAYDLEFESSELLYAEHSRAGDRHAPGTSAILAADEPVEEPDAFTLAAVVEAVEVGLLGPDWLIRDAKRALAWLIRQSPAALAKIRGLLAEVDGPPRRGCLFNVAQGWQGGSSLAHGIPRRRDEAWTPTSSSMTASSAASSSAA